MDLLENLNVAQKEVVISNDRPILVLAGAGSGKTHTIIHKIAYLIKEEMFHPSSLLVVTFTNKAAKELKERLRKFNIFNIHWVGTFHSICARILRMEEDFLPFDKNYSIYDTSDQKNVIKKIVKEYNLDSKIFSPGKVLSIISKQKNNAIFPQDYDYANEKTPFLKEYKKIYTKYQDYLLQNNALDFDDLLLYTMQLLQENSEVRDKYQEKFKYILVDEYQDTNKIQFSIVNFLAQKHNNICVVGDDDQAIYSWRGANIENILNFENIYKNVKAIKLEENYRSTKPILDLANYLIKNNNFRHKKKLFTQKDKGEIPILNILKDENEEADFIARFILDNSLKNKNIAVLYRTNSQSRPLEASMYKHGLAYQIIGGVNFFSRKEIKDIVAYLKILTNPKDSEALQRIINYPLRGIGKTSINKIHNYAFENNLSFFEALSYSDSFLSGKAKDNLKKILTMYSEWQTKLEEKNILEILQQITEDIDLFKVLAEEDGENSNDKVDNLKEFFVFAREFSERSNENTNIYDFLQNVSLHTDVDDLAEGENKVKLMTIHNAKGLEFDCIFLVGIEEGLLPHSLSLFSEKEIEEERRLMYVAITRAKERLILSRARQRSRLTSLGIEKLSSEESRFLKELSSSNLLNKSNINISTEKIEKPVYKTKPIIIKTNPFYKIGQIVFHERFGKGKILNVEGDNKNAKLTISFVKGELKKIMGDFIKVL